MNDGERSESERFDAVVRQMVSVSREELEETRKSLEEDKRESGLRLASPLSRFRSSQVNYCPF